MLHIAQSGPGRLLVLLSSCCWDRWRVGGRPRLGRRSSDLASRSSTSPRQPLGCERDPGLRTRTCTRPDRSWLRARRKVVQLYRVQLYVLISLNALRPAMAYASAWGCTCTSARVALREANATGNRTRSSQRLACFTAEYCAMPWPKLLTSKLPSHSEPDAKDICLRT